ncbi:MAG: acyl carrier protein [Myxococcota bacterium]
MTERPSSARDISSGAALQVWIVTAIAEALDTQPEKIAVDVPFTEMGIDSLKAFSLTGDLSEWADLELPATLFWDYPDVRALVKYLSEALDIDP